MSSQYPSRETGAGTPPSPFTRVRRKPGRARYDAAAVHAVIDAAPVSHAATVRNGRPAVPPMAHGRIGDMLYLHGSAMAWLFRDTDAGSPVCVTAAILDGLVLGRSARNHSVNYRSVTIHGNAEHVTDPQEILNGLRAIVNHVVAGRWDQVRKPTSAEIRETGLWRLQLAEASVKARTGSTLDPDSDRVTPVWAGVSVTVLSPPILYNSRAMIYPGHIEETAMNGKAGGNQGPRRAGALAVVAAAAMLTACSAVHVSAGSGSSGGAAPATASPPGAAATDCLALASPCYTPQRLRVAYGIQALLDRGITGRGQTVVLLEFPPAAAGSATDIRQDLARFDGMFGLPTVQLQVVNTLAHEASPWLAAGEEVEDTEIVHAVAPDAAIREVLIPSLDTAGIGTVTAAFLAALRLGLTQGGVISLSDDAGEQCFPPAAVARGSLILQAAQRDRVTVVFSTGDAGAASDTCPGAGPESAVVKGVNWPASDPLALAVGGTSLQASRATGAYISETAWNIPAGAGGSAPKASGGGFSRLFPRPAYQDGIAGIGATRGVPDVAADADPGTGMALAFSGGSEGNILIGAGGTSAAAPLWAAVIALAGQYAGRPLGFVNPALYQIGRSAFYRQAFHDVTTGTNTVQFPTKTITGYQAAPGWDPVTGWGSPNAQILVPLLARYAVP